MTTKPTTEYVTDVEHQVGCWKIDDRSALYLDRIIHETQPAYFDDGRIWAGDEWEFEENWEPYRLRCSGCDAERFVVIDQIDEVVALTSENCARSYRGGHYVNYDRKPCEYCGYTGKRA